MLSRASLSAAEVVFRRKSGAREATDWPMELANIW
jgi:hypothetical protein